MKKNVPAIVEKLESLYNLSEFVIFKDPIDALICCILTQHSRDAIAIPVFRKLKDYYKDWDDLIQKGPKILIEMICSTGLANQKSRTIIRSLEFIKKQIGSYSLESLNGMSLLEARQWLMQIPGVGPKTASIVLCFAMNKNAIPVDTHVHRVCKRIGFIPQKASADLAHDLLLNIVPEKWAYRFHVALIQHGRMVCKSIKPRCNECIIKKECDWYKNYKDNSITTSLQ